MSRPQSPEYSPVRLPVGPHPMAKRRTNSSDERSSTASCSSYSSSTTSSTIPSPSDDDNQAEGGDPFGLEFSLANVELDPHEYFPPRPVRASSLALPAPNTKARAADRHAGDEVDDPEHEDEQIVVTQGWDPAQDVPTPRQEDRPLGSVTHAAGSAVELDSFPFVQPTDTAPTLSTTPEAYEDPLPTNPLPHLHLIPRPPPSPAVRKYSSGLLTATRALLQLSLSPNPSPSRDGNSSYFPRSTEGSDHDRRGENNPFAPSDAHTFGEPPDAEDDEGDDRFPAPHHQRGEHVSNTDEDGAFTLEDQCSYDRRFARLRREAEDRAEALRALRAGGAGWADAVEEEEAEDRQPAWLAGHDRHLSDATTATWSEGDEGLGDEGVHHVEFSGYP